jgi:hypothetical protein
VFAHPGEAVTHGIGRACVHRIYGQRGRHQMFAEILPLEGGTGTLAGKLPAGPRQLRAIDFRTGDPGLDLVARNGEYLDPAIGAVSLPARQHLVADRFTQRAQVEPRQRRSFVSRFRHKGCR